MLKVQARRRRQGPAIDGTIARRARSTSRDNRKWWLQPEMPVNHARPATPRKAPRVHDRDRAHHPFAKDTSKISPNDKRSKRLLLLLYPAGVQISTSLAIVVTIDDKAVDRGGCGHWTWRNLCSLRTPHLCPYLHQRRLFTWAPTLTSRRNISATEADIWKN